MWCVFCEVELLFTNDRIYDIDGICQHFCCYLPEFLYSFMEDMLLCLSIIRVHNNSDENCLLQWENGNSLENQDRRIKSSQEGGRPVPTLLVYY